MQILGNKDTDCLNRKKKFHLGVIKIIYQRNRNAGSENFKVDRLAKKTSG